MTTPASPMKEEPKEEAKVLVYQVQPMTSPVNLGGLEVQKTAERPAPMPRATDVIVSERGTVREILDHRITQAYDAAGEERWDDCLRWLADAQTAVSTIKNLGLELETAERMKLNHD